MRSPASSRSTSATASARRSARRRSTQMRELPFYTNWSYAHPRAIELARRARLAGARRPEPRLLRLGRLGGGRVGVEAGAPVLPRPRRQEARRRRDEARRARRRAAAAQVQGDRAPGRLSRDDDGSALDQRHPGAAHDVRAARARGPARDEHEPLPPAGRRDRGGVHARCCSTISSRRSSRWGRRRSASCTWSPSRTRAGFTPPAGYWRGVRALCDRYDILLSADEVITAFGRLGHWFGSERYDIRPDIVCCAKGLSSSYAAIGGRDRNRRGDGAVPRLDLDVLARHHVRRPSRDVRDRAQEHRDHEARAAHRARAREPGRVPRDVGELLDLPIVGDVRGTGYFYAIELVKNARRARRSRPRSARRCCAASSRRRCSSAG